MFKKKSEKNTMYRRSVVAATVLFVAVGSVTAFGASTGQSTKGAFNRTCASCHGQTGTPTAVGKSLNAPDLRSTIVQHQTDAGLRAIISNGKGNMPPFKSSLSDAQIAELVAYVRALAKQHK